MERHRAVSKRSLFLIVALAAICTAAIGASTIFSGARPGQESRQLRNRTRALQVVGVENISDATGQLLRLKLRNGYDQKITAYMIGDDVVSHTEDFICCDTGIEPGATYTKDIPAENFRSEIELRCVVLADGSGDGLAKEIRAIKEHRAGMKLQLSRIIPLFQQAMDAPDAEMPSVLSRLRSQLRSLPGGEDKSLPSGVSSGLHNGKESTLHEVLEIERQSQEYGTTSIRERLRQAKEMYERRIARL